MPTIKSVEFVIPGFDKDYIEFKSNALLSDADIILFCPNTEYASQNYRDHWKEEIAHALKLGKTIFVLLITKDNFNYDFLPYVPVEIVSASEVRAYSKSKMFESLYNNFKDFWNVKAYLKAKKEPVEVLFTTKNNDRILGALFKVNDGHLILLPALEYDDEDFWSDNDWNEDGIIFGRKLVQHLSHIHNTLNSEVEISEKPDWTDLPEFQLVESVRLIRQIEKNVTTIDELTFKNDELFNVLKDKELLKDLLFETGPKLEIAVIHALKQLGYKAENFDSGILELDQVILSPEGDRFVGECEGKDNKAIDITKFRQLLDELSEDYEREEIDEKAFGLLFGNPQRLTNPKERTVDFTEKCKRGAERESIGLINTVDLFIAAKYIAENNDEKFKSDCRIAIKNQLGSIIKFPKPQIQIKN